MSRDPEETAAAEAPAGRWATFQALSHTIGLVLLGILPFALFAYFSIGKSDAPEQQETPDVVDEESLNATSVQLAFPFGGPPPAPLAPVAPVDNVPLEIPTSEPVVAPSSKQCSNGKDDDRDGRRDYPGDPGCSSRSDSSESPNPAPKPAPTKAAVVAPAPKVAPPPPPPVAPPPPLPPAGKTACTDRVDNDKDGKIDGADPGCSGSLDLNEADPPPPRPRPVPPPPVPVPPPPVPPPPVPPPPVPPAPVPPPPVSPPPVDPNLP